MTTILDRIVEKKKEELSSLILPSERLVTRSKYSLTDSIRNSQHPLGIIAEVKKASPSKGILTHDFNPVAIAKSYQSIGAAGISVLTDQSFFQGHADYLTAIKSEVTNPILRKDFIIHEKEVSYSERIGADAILLIAAILESSQLKELHTQAVELGMDVLVEVHNESELEKVLSHITPHLIGVNNRNLSTFDTDLTTTKRLQQYIPKEITLISESGIHSKNDVDKLRELNVNGILVGEGFMTSQNKQQFVDSLFYVSDKK
ncbi:indole-3-glycerol phosphate synthase [Salipaludibacillus neizhouensis]|uniref:Indole-3-glycerol phosphate synthase n=1 Tax=Salipaludibacillus neizhouensis TaxID=885475 RepID=A0A3A9KD73_9BACI|nr:indole-3-glycerol phosphate synthase TrpC [Salipaludibacillus neizhouensis]RKL67583.1 indole-3-glycerol phosphate synthase [Salipaludibacillus neizhouensis]